MKLNFKSKTKQFRRVKITPHHDKKLQEERFLKIYEKRNQGFMFDYDFYNKFQRMLNTHGFKKLSQYCKVNRLKLSKLNKNEKIAVLLEYLIINNNNYRHGITQKDRLRYSNNEEKNRELNQFAQNYWDGCEHKFQEYILNKVEETLIETSSDLFEQMNNFNELLELLDCFIFEPKFDYEKWKNRVKQHNRQIIKEAVFGK